MPPSTHNATWLLVTFRKWRCSNCQSTWSSGIHRMRYCPSCGYFMEGREVYRRKQKTYQTASQYRKREEKEEP